MFEALIQQATTTASDNVLTAVVSIVGSLAVIVPIVAHFIGKINPKLRIVSQYADTFAQKNAEYADDFLILADAIKMTSPEMEKFIREKSGKDIDYYASRMKIAAEQAQRFKAKLQDQDPELLANSDKDLPREDLRTTNMINK